MSDFVKQYYNYNEPYRELPWISRIGKQMYREEKCKNNLYLKEIIIPFLTLFIMGFIYLFIFRNYGIGIPCVFNKITGLQCPGCGMTRALSEIWSGNFAEAWQYNPLSLTVLPVLGCYLFYRQIKERIKKIDQFSLWEYLLLIVLSILTIIYCFFRNK